MRHRGKPAERARIAYQHVEPAEALEQAGTEPVECRTLGQVERQQRRMPADGANGVVGLLQAALRARGRHDMHPAPGEFDGHRRADAAAGPGP